MVSLFLILASVALIWDPSPDATVTGYAIYGSGAGQSFRQDTGTNLTTEITNLQTSVTYTFYAVAYNAAGTESDPSNTLEFTSYPILPLVAPLNPRAERIQ